MLEAKHLMALNLLLDGKTYKEVASAIGCSEHLIQRWVSGDVSAGKVSAEFSMEYKRLKKEKADETTENLGQVRLRISRRLREWVEKLKFPMSQDNMDYAIEIMKVLKEPPQRVDITQIYNMQFQNGEDIVHEFKRLNAIAGDGAASSQRGTVQEAKSGRPTSLPGFIKRRGFPKKTGKGNVLPAQPEAGSVPPEHSEDEGDIRG